MNCFCHLLIVRSVLFLINLTARETLDGSPIAKRSAIQRFDAVVLVPINQAIACFLPMRD
jgi:hypothetical protein